MLEQILNRSLYFYPRESAKQSKILKNVQRSYQAKAYYSAIMLADLFELRLLNTVRTQNNAPPTLYLKQFERVYLCDKPQRSE